MGLERLFRMGRSPARREVALSFPGIPQELQGDPDVLLAQLVISRVTTAISGELQPSGGQRQPYPLYTIDIMDFDKKETIDVDVVYDPARHGIQELTTIGPALWERITDERRVGEIRPYLQAVARRLRAG